MGLTICSRSDLLNAARAVAMAGDAPLNARDMDGPTAYEYGYAKAVLLFALALGLVSERTQVEDVAIELLRPPTERL